MKSRFSSQSGPLATVNCQFCWVFWIIFWKRWKNPPLNQREQFSVVVSSPPQCHRFFSQKLNIMARRPTKHKQGDLEEPIYAEESESRGKSSLTWKNTMTSREKPPIRLTYEERKIVLVNLPFSLFHEHSSWFLHSFFFPPKIVIFKLSINTINISI